jgi:hypothetical protein
VKQTQLLCLIRTGSGRRKSTTTSTHHAVHWYRMEPHRRAARVTVSEVAAHLARALCLERSASRALVERASFSRRVLHVGLVSFKPCELRIELSLEAAPDCYEFQNIHRSITSGFTVRVNDVDYEVVSSDPHWLCVRLYDQARQCLRASKIEHVAWPDVRELYIY